MEGAARRQGPMEGVVRWQLELGDKVIARIDADEYDFPFTYGRLVDSPAFERFRRYFTDDNDWPDDDPQLEALCGEVHDQGCFILREMPTGVAYRGVCLNHDGEQVVWFRHGDPV
jgi:hypothetical protein